MQCIKDIIGSNNENVEEIDALKEKQIECDNWNAIEGNLNEIDGIECNICKNKGYVGIISKSGYLVAKNCECMKARNTFRRLSNCGISKTTLEHYNFRNWECKESWQKQILDICKKFYLKVKSGAADWFILSGTSGSGKTHCCTALFQELIRSLNKSGYYMMWNDEIPQLLSLRKSSYTDNQEKYNDTINTLKNIEVLYIDDLFKLDKRYKEDSLSIAFEILNARYVNNRITLISTEIEKNQFENIDTAIWGRCNEKTNMGEFWVSITGNNKNQRV